MYNQFLVFQSTCTFMAFVCFWFLFFFCVYCFNCWFAATISPDGMHCIDWSWCQTTWTIHRFHRNIFIFMLPNKKCQRDNSLWLIYSILPVDPWAQSLTNKINIHHTVYPLFRICLMFLVAVITFLIITILEKQFLSPQNRWIRCVVWYLHTRTMSP